MNIQSRIKKIEQILKADTKYHKFIQLIQSKPHSNIYAVSEQYKGKYKHYNTDNLEDFYKQNTGDTTHILQIDIVDNSKLKEYFFSCEEA